MEKSMPLEKNLQNFSDACAANDILSSLCEDISLLLGLS